MASGLSPSTVLNHLNYVMGSVIHNIELSDEEMMRIVMDKSRDTFSKYFPYIYRYTAKQSDEVEGRTSTYRVQSDLKLTNVHQVLIVGSYSGSAGGSYGTPYNADPFGAQMTADYMSQRRTPITWKFYPPNTVEIFPKSLGYRDVMLEMTAVHPAHLKTISPGLKNEFLDLATYDVLISLYPIRHRFENMTTPFGDIQPFLNQVDSAESQRKELLEFFAAKYLTSGQAKRIYTTNQGV